MTRESRERRTAVSGLLAGAVVWGLIWYPYRALARGGLAAIEATTLSYAIALALGLALLWRRLRWPTQPGLLLTIALAAGACNIGYVVATLTGEVVRVLLLFYLAPLWTVLLARLLLQEPITRDALVVVCLSLGGAVAMLWRPGTGIPFPVHVAEWAGLVAGFLFALSNVLIRKASEIGIETKTLAVFAGVLVLGVAVHSVGETAGPWPDQAFPGHLWIVLGLLGVVLLAVNLVVQFGLMRTAPTRAIVIMLFELVVAGFAAWLLEGERLGWQEWAGGAMIVAASVYSGRLEKRME